MLTKVNKIEWGYLQGSTLSIVHPRFIQCTRQKLELCRTKWPKKHKITQKFIQTLNLR